MWEPGAGLAQDKISIPINRRLDVLKKHRGKQPYRRLYKQAARLLGDWKLEVAGIIIDGPRLESIADGNPREPFQRALREGLRRPIDRDDFLFFLDDVLRAGRKGLRGKLVYVPPGRARNAGITVHPRDVFRPRRPRLYADGKDLLNIDKPPPQKKLPPAQDGDLLGPNWAARYLNPYSRERKLELLRKESPSPTFADRIQSLIVQLEAQDCEVGLYTTVRNRHRGYLMYGAFILSRQSTSRQVKRTARRLNRYNQAWGLEVPIQWMHPRGWQKTVEAARQMADAYPVVYASKAGAKRSRHYDGKAVDLSAVGLPRRLTLKAPDGKTRTFNLAGSHQTRDLNLTPAIIKWVERHFALKKLKRDYPHWNDDSPEAREDDQRKRKERQSP